MACPCPCCEKTGACCNDGACTQETCADCESAGGQWQGADTACESGDCPCDPPADHTQCEKCVDGEVVDRCAEGQYCCDGVCQDEPCPSPEPGACCRCGGVGTVNTGGAFVTEAEADDAAALDNIFLDSLEDELEDFGYECIVNSPSLVYPCDDPEGCGDANWFTDGGRIDAVCCGAIDYEGAVGLFFYPCISGPERTCSDNVEAEDCDSCGDTHHPGEACEDEPCNPLP